MALRNFSSLKASLTQLAVTGVMALAIGLFIGMTSFYHIRSFDQAFTKFMHNPTPENEAALNVERAKLQHMRNVDSLKAALLFFFTSLRRLFACLPRNL